MSNTGLIPEPIAPNTGFLGAVAGDLPDILPSGDWEPYLPIFESQSRFGLETMNCVQCSRLNATEILSNFHGKPLNLSDRALGWAAGTTKNGNTYSNCDFWLRRRGVCAEPSWPWDQELSWDEYYIEPPQDVQDEMLALLDKWVFGQRVYVPSDVESLKAALKKGPLWFCTNDHSMVIYRVDDKGIHIFDTYPLQGDGKRHWTLSEASKIEAAYLVPFTPKEFTSKPMLKLPPNCLVAVVDGHGERLMNVDGTKLYQDDAGKIDLELEARNSKPCPEATCEHCAPGQYVAHTKTSTIPVVHVKTEDIKNVPRVNLKNEPV